ncbi:MAG: flagellar basal body-associated FliL family protein [Treponema sp.]|jgi:flagellar FliL protein|nr:flagellar basal body-associated FliL family protein [Treponema sp.]
MSDAKDDIIEGDEGGEGEDQKKKKGAGLAALLPNLLKWGAIGLVVIILMVTTVIVAVNLSSRGGQNQTAAADPSSPYLGKRPTYTYFTSIGTVRTRTRDAVSHSVSVDMVLGYDEGDKNTPAELTSRLYELRDFVRTFFSGKSAEELAPENEALLKQEILEYLNTRILANSKVRIITFNQLDIMEL